MTKEELNVVTNVASQLEHATDLNTINKIYRQSRNWARYHCYFAEACTKERCHELNVLFKNLRKSAIERI